MAGPVCCDVGEHAREGLELAAAAHQRRVEATRTPGRTGKHVHQPNRVDRPSTISAARFDGLDLHRACDKPARRLADQDLARRGRFLEPLGDVDRRAGGQWLTLGAITHDDLTGVHTDADAEPHAPRLLKLSVQTGQCIAHAGGSPYRAYRVVFMDNGNAEDGHDRVTEIDLGSPAVTLQHGAHLIEAARHQPLQGLRIELPRQAGEVN